MSSSSSTSASPWQRCRAGDGAPARTGRPLRSARRVQQLLEGVGDAQRLVELAIRDVGGLAVEADGRHVILEQEVDPLRALNAGGGIAHDVLAHDVHQVGDLGLEVREVRLQRAVPRGDKHALVSLSKITQRSSWIVSTFSTGSEICAARSLKVWRSRSAPPGTSGTMKVAQRSWPFR